MTDVAIATDGLSVTGHAISRYIERVASGTVQEAIAALTSPTIKLAAQFGAPCVILSSGHRVVLDGEKVVTVLPHRALPLNYQRPIGF